MYTYIYYRDGDGVVRWRCDDLPTVIRRAARDAQGTVKPMSVSGPDIFLDIFVLRVVTRDVLQLGLRDVTDVQIRTACKFALEAA